MQKKKEKTAEQKGITFMQKNWCESEIRKTSMH